MNLNAICTRIKISDKRSLLIFLWPFFETFFSDLPFWSHVCTAKLYVIIITDICMNFQYFSWDSCVVCPLKVWALWRASLKQPSAFWSIKQETQQQKPLVIFHKCSWVCQTINTLHNLWPGLKKTKKKRQNAKDNELAFKLFTFLTLPTRQTIRRLGNYYDHLTRLFEIFLFFVGHMCKWWANFHSTLFPFIGIRM